MANLPPLPSLIRASAADAATIQMHKASRAKWNRADWNKMSATLERLIRACYSAPGDAADYCFIRFQEAEQLERNGVLGLMSDFSELFSVEARS